MERADRRAHLNAAHIILLLISADFIASEYCYGMEMKKALARHQSGSARVIPILLRPADWKTTPFANLQVLPKNIQLITTWKNEDLAYTEIALALRVLIKQYNNEWSSQVNFVANNNSETYLDDGANQQDEISKPAAGWRNEMYISADILNALENLINYEESRVHGELQGCALLPFEQSQEAGQRPFCEYMLDYGKRSDRSAPGVTELLVDEGKYHSRIFQIPCEKAFYLQF